MNMLILAAVALVVLLALALMPAKRKPPPPIAEAMRDVERAAAKAVAGEQYPADVVWVSHRLRLTLTPANANLIASALQMFEREAAARHVARTLGLQFETTKGD